MQSYNTNLWTITIQVWDIIQVSNRVETRERERDDSNSYKVAEIGVEFYSTIASLYCLVFKN